MPPRKGTSPSRAKTGDAHTHSPPALPDHGEDSSSTLIEAPQARAPGKLTAHNFPDGGGSGGAEAFRRAQKNRGHA